MTPTSFPQANITYGPPPGVDESQVSSIPAWVGSINGGNNDGEDVSIVAWQPSQSDVERMIAGQPVFLMVFGGLPPHCLLTEFPLTSVRKADGL